MRRKGISPEYIYEGINGSFNMREKRSIFGSKMMDIEDTIVLDNRDVVYYQQLNGEQIDINQENSLSPNLYSIVTDKASNHQITFDPTQTDTDKNNKTKWAIEFNMKKVLRNYIYAQIKSARSFEGVKNNATSTRSVNQSIYDYIDMNIIDRYDYSDITFFLEYKSLDVNSNINRYETNFNSSVESIENKFSNIRTVFSNDKSIVRILFTQQEDSKSSTFDYYFNITFSKK